MNLSYIQPPSPSTDGKITIKPPPLVAQKGMVRWNTTLVGFFLDKLPFSLVQNGAQKLWGSKGLVEVLANSNGFYFFRFSSLDFMNMVIDGGPWYFGGRPIFLQKWKPSMNLSKAGCKKVPIWVHFYNVPLEFWNEDGLSFIASVVGKPLHADKMTEHIKRISYARLCIEVGVDSVLPDSFNLELEDGSLVEILIEYNWVPKKCEHCKEFGHFSKACFKQPRQEWTKKSSPSSDSIRSSKSEDGWQQVKRNGKAPIIDKTPPPTNDINLQINTCITRNAFDPLGEEINAMEAVFSSKEDGLNVKMDSIPLTSENEMDADMALNHPGNSNALSQVVSHDVSSPSDNCSIFLNDSLIQKIHSVDELDSKHRKKKKDAKHRKGGPDPTPSHSSS